MGLRVLVVDANRQCRDAVLHQLDDVASVEECTDFQSARDRLLLTRPDLLITNIRLGEFNGLHLVYLAAGEGLSTRCVVYGRPTDVGLAREAQAIGAFFEPALYSFPAVRPYVQSSLPLRDRRDPVYQVIRWGRRSNDLPPKYTTWIM